MKTKFYWVALLASGPVFYVVIMWFKERRAKTRAPAATQFRSPVATEPAVS